MTAGFWLLSHDSHFAKSNWQLYLSRYSRRARSHNKSAIGVTRYSTIAYANYLGNTSAKYAEGTAFAFALCELVQRGLPIVLRNDFVTASAAIQR
jgi:hypothetical protein